MSFWGHVYFRRRSEGRAWPLEVFEKEVEGYSLWGRVKDVEFEIEFTRGLGKDAAFGGYISRTCWRFNIQFLITASHILSL